MKIFTAIKRAHKYMDLWPEEPVLVAAFVELRYRRMMLLGRKLIPPAIAMMLFWIYFTCGGIDGLTLLFFHPQAGSMYLYLSVVTVLLSIVLLLQMPLIGLYWFYQRSKTELNERQKSFYQDLCKQLQQTPEPRPTMYELAEILNTAIKTLKEKDFLERI